MRPRKKRLDPANQKRIVEEARRANAERQQGYRDQALALFPHVCARCGREFSGKNLRELTVHHKDHDHMNNPPDGSNWELLCLYCHDNEHQDLSESGYRDGATRERHSEEALGHNPFAELGDLVKPAEEDSEPE